MTVEKGLPAVWIVDDDALVRDSLRSLIETVGWHVSTYANARDLLDALEAEQPSCLVVDVRMPGLSGLELQAELRARGANVPIIMMTAYAEVPMAVHALKAGAVDFIEKPFDGGVLLDRIRQVIDADEHVRRVRAEQQAVAARLARLTRRQREVLDGLKAGKPSKVIAAELGLSPKTVDVHRSRIMRTLEAGSLPDLFRLLVLGQRTERRPIGR